MAVRDGWRMPEGLLGCNGLGAAFHGTVDWVDAESFGYRQSFTAGIRFFASCVVGSHELSF
jgi:hypothetical protein